MADYGTGQRATLRSNAGATRLRRATQTPTKTDEAMRAHGMKHTCDKCQITYAVPTGDLAKCPACSLERVVDEQKVEILQLRNELKMATDRLVRAEREVNLQSAMRAAIELCDENDYAWLKTQMYQYKIDKSVILKPTHGRIAGQKSGQRMEVNGFMAVPRKGDPEAHGCTSMGGLAIAGYFDEAVASVGGAAAMATMLRAWYKYLPGADQ